MNSSIIISILPHKDFELVRRDNTNTQKCLISRICIDSISFYILILDVLILCTKDFFVNRDKVIILNREQIIKVTFSIN